MTSSLNQPPETHSHTNPPHTPDPKTVAAQLPDDFPCDAVDALEKMRAQIAADVDTQQGTWLSHSPWQRYWPAALGIGTSVLFFVVMGGRSTGSWSFASVVVGAVATGFAFAAAALAATKPSKAERLAQASFVIGLIAVMSEAARTWGGPLLEPQGAERCMTAGVVGAVLPVSLLALQLYRSRAPVRLWHAVAASLGGAFGSAVGVWHHCSASHSGHVLWAHLAVPVLVGAVSSCCLQLLLRRRAPSNLPRTPPNTPNTPTDKPPNP